MKTFKTSFAYLIVALLITSCSKDDTEPKINFENQKIVFQYEYINYAWGYTHQGWIMDTAGNVYCYNLPNNWIFIGDDDAISKDEMEQNLLNVDSIGTFINKSTVSAKMQLIQQAQQGQITVPEEVMCDAGISVFSAFIYNAAEDNYEAVLIRQVGDAQATNGSAAAEDLYNWMVGINIDLYSLCKKTPNTALFSF